MKKLLTLVLCGVIAASTTPVAYAADDTDLWPNADYYFIQRPTEEKKSALNNRLRTIGSILRKTLAIATGALVSYKSLAYLHRTPEQLKDANQLGLAHKLIGLTETYTNPLINFAFDTTCAWLGKEDEQKQVPRPPLISRSRLNIGIAGGLGITTLLATYKLLGILAYSLNRNRIVDLKTIYSALKNCGDHGTNREFAASLPASIRRDLRMALGEGNDLTDEAALALLAKIRERIDDHIAQSQRSTPLSTPPTKSTRPVIVIR